MSPRWLAPRSLALHVALCAWVGCCVLAAWWQVGRAIQGNQYSYLYAVEWPGFAGLGVFVWWRALHAEPRDLAASSATRRDLEESRRAEERVAMRDRDHEDAELAAYNDHLARLALAGRRKTWRR